MIALRFANPGDPSEKSQFQQCMADYLALEQAVLFRRTLLPRLAGIAVLTRIIDWRFGIPSASAVVTAWLAVFAAGAVWIKWHFSRRFARSSSRFRVESTVQADRVPCGNNLG